MGPLPSAMLTVSTLVESSFSPSSSEEHSIFAEFNHCSSRRLSFDLNAHVLQLAVCPDVKGPASGVGYYLANPPARHPGNVFKQSCGRSYVGRGPEERLCRNNGTWSGTAISCHRSKFASSSATELLSHE